MNPSSNTATKNTNQSATVLFQYGDWRSLVNSSTGFSSQSKTIREVTDLRASLINYYRIDLNSAGLYASYIDRCS